MKKSRLYAVIDKKALRNRALGVFVKQIKKSSVDIIQLRDKQGSKINILKDALIVKQILSKNKKILFIINDHLDIAKIANSDGVHLGQSDIPIALARKILGQNKIIGVSCHSLPQALKAQKQGADYIGIGPIFSTPTKPEYKPVGLRLIKKCVGKIKIPFFAIGAIEEKNLKRIVSSGVKRIAVCRAICKAKNIPVAAKRLSEVLR